MQDNADYPNIEFVLVDYNSKDGLQDWVRQNFQAEIAAGKLKYVYYPGPEKFHAPHAKNIAHRMASGDILVNVDADNFTGPGFARWIAETMEKETAMAQRAHKKGVFLRPKLAQYALSERSGTGGRIALPKEAFYQVGGYAETIQGWGGDDTALSMHLEKAGYLYKPIPKAYLSDISHSDAERGKHTKQHPSLVRLTNFCNKLNRPQRGTNGARFGCGTVYVNFSAHPYTIGPATALAADIGLVR